MNKNKIFLDKEGYEQYLEEINDLKNLLKKNGSTKSGAYRKYAGDGWHDNFEFEEAKRKEFGIIKDLEDKLIAVRNIVIVDNKHNPLLVNIGDKLRLKLKFSDTESEEGIYILTGGTIYKENANVKIISLNSPLGNAIYGKAIGKSVNYSVDENKIEVEIKEKLI